MVWEEKSHIRLSDAGDVVGAVGTEGPIDARRRRGLRGSGNSRENLTQHPPAIYDAALSSDKPEMNWTGALPRKRSVGRRATYHARGAVRQHEVADTLDST